MTVVPSLDRPQRAPEVELIGRSPDSGFATDYWLLCYAGSNYIQITNLLYHLLLFADGMRSVDEIARQIGASTGIEVTSDDVHWLIRNHLASSGLLVQADSGPSDARTEMGRTTAAKPVGRAHQRPSAATAPTPLLGIRSRVPLLSYRVTAPLTGLLQHLFWPPLMVAAVILVAGINVWLYRSADVLGSVQAVLFTPRLALLLLAIDLAMRLFHEFGHAAALRRAGVRYGTIGFAFLIIWPVFYTDVTHAYRLNRAQRIRVDLGGIYFQLFVIIALYLAYMLTGQAALLVAIVVTGLSILEQFTPLIRFDGYYAAADIIGVHEPMSLILPFVADHLPWRRQQPKRLPPMKPFAKVAFGVYLLLMLGFLVYPLVIAPLYGAEIVRQLVASGTFFEHQFVLAWLNHEVVPQIYATLQFAMWFLLPLGLGLFVLRMLQRMLRLGRALDRIARQRWPKLQVDLACGLGVALLALTAGPVMPSTASQLGQALEASKTTPRPVVMALALTPPGPRALLVPQAAMLAPAPIGNSIAPASAFAAAPSARPTDAVVASQAARWFQAPASPSAVTSSSPSSATTSHDSEETLWAAQLVDAYFQSINSADYQAAYDYLGVAVRQLQSFSDFVLGFATTAHDTVHTDSVAPVGAARYGVTISLDALQTDGLLRHFRGTYVIGQEAGAWKIVDVQVHELDPGSDADRTPSSIDELSPAAAPTLDGQVPELQSPGGAPGATNGQPGGAAIPPPLPTPSPLPMPSMLPMPSPLPAPSVLPMPSGQGP